MTDHAPPTTIVFDTDCVLCSGLAHFMLRHERDDLTRFVSAWSPKGADLARTHGLSAEDLNLTFLVVRNGVALTRSDAAFALLPHLKMPYRALIVLRAVPRPVRDFFYDRIARNRYRWFGRKDACFVPPPNQKHRFIGA